jgi:hypothetical protein
VTGIAFMFTRLGAKNLELLHELLPKAAVVGALANPNDPNSAPQVRDLQAAAQALGIQLIILGAGSARRDRIAATQEHNGNDLRCRFGRKRRREKIRGDDRDSMVN